MYDSLKAKAGKVVDDTRVAAHTRYLLRFDLKTLEHTWKSFITPEKDWQLIEHTESAHNIPALIADTLYRPPISLIPPFLSHTSFLYE